MSNASARDRRRKPDRRAQPTSPLSRASLTGSRRHYRRAQDQARYHYVDRYSPRSVLVIIIVILLSIADAVLTLKLMALGAVEANPVMHFFMQFGVLPFMVSKHLLTGAGLLLFLVHKNYAVVGGPIRVKHLMLVVLCIYVLLIFYELILFVVMA